MEYLNATLGGREMYIPVNEKLGQMMVLAHRRLNYQKHIARMRHAYTGEISVGLVDMTSDFFYALEDVMDEQGYPDVFHKQFELFTVEQRKILYELFREDKSVKFLVLVRGYKEEEVQTAIRAFFESLKEKIN